MPKAGLNYFIDQIENDFPDFFDWTITQGEDGYTSVFVICKRCRFVFERALKEMLGGLRQGNEVCPLCAYIKRSMQTSYGDFLSLATKIHGNAISFYEEGYYGLNRRGNFLCNNCGEWFQKKPRNILRGQGCNLCRGSSGEKIIAQVLRDLGIRFEREKTFDDCRDIQPLPFDFYLPDYNCLIEYQGELHFRPSGRPNGQVKFAERKQHDQIKRDWADRCGRKLIPVPYTIKDLGRLKRGLIERLNL